MNKRGITLISLIITVIILLILMGISMDLIINKKIFSSAQEVVNKSEKQMDTHQEVTEEARNTIKPPDIATITFMVGSAVFLTKRVMGKIKFPLQQPTGVAQVFDGWYYDAECTQEAKEGDNITQDITLYANMLGITNPLNGKTIGSWEDLNEISELYQYNFKGNVQPTELTRPNNHIPFYSEILEDGSVELRLAVGSGLYSMLNGKLTIKHFVPYIDDLSVNGCWCDYIAKFSVEKSNGTKVEIEDDFILKYWYTPCILAGTLVTLANGTKKKIEDLTYEDNLLVWDFDNACMASAKPLWLQKEQKAERYNLLKFSDGNILKTINQHRILNIEKGKFTYPMTDETPIGTTTLNDKGEKVKLVSKEIIEEKVTYYNLITKYHMNAFTGGILTSCRFSNLYPIKDMKYVKDNRKLVGLEEYSNIPKEYYEGLRLAEQPRVINRENDDISHAKTITEYVENLIESAK